MKIELLLNITCDNTRIARKLADVLEGEGRVTRLPQNEIFIEGRFSMQQLENLINSLYRNQSVSSFIRRAHFGGGDLRTVAEWVRTQPE